jgi:hypothetical protein
MRGIDARYIKNAEISVREITDANISADAEPAASAMSMITVISCPAPFERLEVSSTPTIGDRTTRKPYEESGPRRQRRGPE